MFEGIVRLDTWRKVNTLISIKKKKDFWESLFLVYGSDGRYMSQIHIFYKEGLGT